jgi:hypothetical protein
MGRHPLPRGNEEARRKRYHTGESQACRRETRDLLSQTRKALESCGAGGAGHDGYAAVVAVGQFLRCVSRPARESAPLLSWLYQHAVRPEFTCHFRWRANSIAFWDNRCVQHNVINDYHGLRRVMRVPRHCLPPKLGDLSLRVRPGVLRIRNQPVDRPAFYLIRRPLVPILARAHYARTRQWGSWACAVSEASFCWNGRGGVASRGAPPIPIVGAKQSQLRA